MAAAKGGKNNASRSGGGGETGRRGARRRTLLNLGIPFVPVDDFINQTEDAVALGYRVLEGVVKEIKQGYNIAVEYNAKQRDADAAGDPAPPIPWQKLVESVASLNDIALEALERGNRIFIDSVAAGINASNKLAGTLAKTRLDADEQTPRLAGPVFDDVLSVEFKPGQANATASWKIDHRGLTRLRIHAQISKLQQVKQRGKPVSHTLSVMSVSFEPAKPPDDEEVSVLTIDFGNIAGNQDPGTYKGQITASNFDLLIARLQVVVAASAQAPRASQAKA